MPITNSDAQGERAKATNPWLILAICSLSLLIVGMDTTIVNIGLPAIREDLDASFSTLQWTIDGYTLAFGSLLILGGSLADRFGRVRIFRIGFAVFTISSLACALAPTGGWLIATRIVQGVGAAMLNPVALSIISHAFSDPADRARAIGVWASVFGISLALGPVLGGILVEFDWRYIFLINVPIGLIAIALVTRYIPESKGARPRRFDPVGQMLVIVALGSLVTATIEGSHLGWSRPVTLALIASTFVSAGALVIYELRRREPLVEMRLFRRRPFAAATTTAVVAFVAFGSFLFLNALYLQDARGLGPIEAGLCMTPVALAVAVISPISGRLVASRGVLLPLVAGGLTMAISGLMLVSLEADTPLAWVLAAYLLFGLGSGALNPPITNTAIGCMPPDQSGVAAAIAATSRQAGIALGVAICGVVTATGADISAAQLASDTHAAWWMIGGLGVAIAVLGVIAAAPEGRADDSSPIPVPGEQGASA